MLCLGDLQAQNNNEGDSSDLTSDKVEREYVMGKGFDHIRQQQLKEGLDEKVHVKSAIIRQFPVVLKWQGIPGCWQ